MDAVEYLKQRARMTHGCDIEVCQYCKLGVNYNGRTIGCEEFEKDYPEEAIKVVEKWVKENPSKTYKSIFVEKFPHASIDSDGSPNVCVTCVFGELERPYGCRDNKIDCVTCWDREATHVWESNAQKCLDEIFEKLLEDTTIVDSVGGNQGREILTERVINKYIKKKKDRK